MTRADFYIGQGPDANWIGSINHDGYPENIPTDILICINPVLYEELVVEFIKTYEYGVIRSEGGKWCWPWGDSRLTDYSYIFEPSVNKVLASKYGKSLFDPVAIKQGEDLIYADAGLGPPKFPMMVSGKREKEWIKHYQDYIKTTETTQTIGISH